MTTPSNSLGWPVWLEPGGEGKQSPKERDQLAKALTSSLHSSVLNARLHHLGRDWKAARAKHWPTESYLSGLGTQTGVYTPRQFLCVPRTEDHIPESLPELYSYVPRGAFCPLDLWSRKLSPSGLLLPSWCCLNLVMTLCGLSILEGFSGFWGDCLSYHFISPSS